MKKEDEWMRVHVQSTKALKRDGSVERDNEAGRREEEQRRVMKRMKGTA